MTRDLRLLLTLVLLTGCSSKGAANLVGDKPARALELPTFAAVAHNGQPRGPEHLKGHPTVIWFYPAAGTAG